MVDYARRLKAFELYAANLKPSAIAKELGVTRQCVGNWKREDKWDEKLYRADRATEFVGENRAAEILAAFKAKLRRRMTELEALCAPTEDPRVRLQAIKVWFQLTDMLEKKGLPGNAGALELEDDLGVGVSRGTGVESDQQSDRGSSVELPPGSDPGLPGPTSDQAEHD